MSNYSFKLDRGFLQPRVYVSHRLRKYNREKSFCYVVVVGHERKVSMIKLDVERRNSNSRTVWTELQLRTFTKYFSFSRQLGILATSGQLKKSTNFSCFTVFHQNSLFMNQNFIPGHVERKFSLTLQGIHLLTSLSLRFKVRRLMSVLQI